MHAFLDFNHRGDIVKEQNVILRVPSYAFSWNPKYFKNENCEVSYDELPQPRKGAQRMRGSACERGKIEGN